MEDPLDFAAIESLRAVRRLARAVAPVATGLPRLELDAIGRAAQSGFHRITGAPPSWISEYVRRIHGHIIKRNADTSAPDGPCLVASARTSFAIYLPESSVSGSSPASSVTWEAAVALGHLELHLSSSDPCDDDDFPEPPPLYVPRLVARTSGQFKARQEAIWWACGFLFPQEEFVDAWNREARDCRRVARWFAVPDLADLAEARARSLGLEEGPGNTPPDTASDRH
jgi:hypothetical protein